MNHVPQRPDALAPINLDLPVGAVKTQLCKLLLSVDRIGWLAGSTSGRFDVRRSSRMLAGSERVFKQRTEQAATTTAVSLVVDMSDSMSGKRARAAAQTAWAIATAVERAGCDITVNGFQMAYESGTRNGSKMSDMALRQGSARGVASYNSGRMVTLKDWGHKCGERRVAFEYFDQLIDGGTPDYHVIRTAAERLNNHVADRKIVIVVTDGMGEPELMKEFCAYSEKHYRIPILGIGIQTKKNWMGNAYDKFVCIEKVEDLADFAIRALIDQIDSKRRRPVEEALAA